MMKRDVPVYLITGFLESGKTQFLDFTIHQSYFQIPDKTLLILCEEGEEEYDEESLKKMNTVIEIIEDPEDFNADTLQMLNKKHQPGRVLVEYNPPCSSTTKPTTPSTTRTDRHGTLTPATEPFTFHFFCSGCTDLFYQIRVPGEKIKSALVLYP